MAVQTVKINLEVYVRLQANMVRSDYGVPGSPVFYEAEDIDFADYTVEIEGVECELKLLPKELQDVILELAEEQSRKGDWE